MLLKLYFCSVISNLYFFENTPANKQTIVAERGREERGRRGEAGTSYYEKKLKNN